MDNECSLTQFSPCYEQQVNVFLSEIVYRSFLLLISKKLIWNSKGEYYNTTAYIILLIILCVDYFYVLYLKLYSRYTVLNIY